MAASIAFAPVACLSREELIQKVMDLQQCIAEMSLKEFTQKQAEVTAKEEALRRREHELDKKAKELAQREAQWGAGDEVVKAKCKNWDGMDGHSPAVPAINLKALMTPTPTRSAHASAMLYGNRPSPEAMPPMPPLPPRCDRSSEEEPMQQQYPRQHCMEAMSPAPRFAIASPPAGYTATAPTQPLPPFTHAAQEPGTPARATRPSGPGEGSATKLKGLWEQRSSGRGLGGGAAERAASYGCSRSARWTAPPSAVAAPMAGGSFAAPMSGRGTPAPKVSLKERLALDEAATNEGHASPLGATGASSFHVGAAQASGWGRSTTSEATSSRPSTPSGLDSFHLGGSGFFPAGRPATTRTPAPKVSLNELLQRDQEIRTSTGGL